MEDEFSKTLDQLLAKAKVLKAGRSDGQSYLEKCREVSHDTREFLTSVKPKLHYLPQEFKERLKSLQELIEKELLYSQAAAKLRDIEASKDFISE